MLSGYLSTQYIYVTINMNVRVFNQNWLKFQVVERELKMYS